MGRRRVHKGVETRCVAPQWQPLLDAVGERLVGDFMWMFEVELADGRRVQAYKHIDTRGYVHLDGDGEAFVYSGDDRYRSAPLADVLAAVFGGLPGLAGVTAEQVEESWAAVARLRKAAPR